MDDIEEPQADEGEAAVVPTSRICIKNLPKHVDAARLREHFAARGEVTDAKVQVEKCARQLLVPCACWSRLCEAAASAAHPADSFLHFSQLRGTGRSRQMAFVGFKTIDQAADAVRFYNQTFLDTSRIEVEVRQVNRLDRLTFAAQPLSDAGTCARLLTHFLAVHPVRPAVRIERHSAAVEQVFRGELPARQEGAKACQGEPRAVDPCSRRAPIPWRCRAVVCVRFSVHGRA